MPITTDRHRRGQNKQALISNKARKGIKVKEGTYI